MITRDYLLRQIHQLIQALNLVLFHKRTQADHLVHAVLNEALVDVTGFSLERIRALERHALIAMCTTNGQFQADLAIAIADLLREDGAPGARARARCLYEAALQTGTAVPVDIHDRIAGLPALPD